MAQPVPPVEEERADEPADEALRTGMFELRELEQRSAGEQPDPELVGGERDRDLDQRHENGPGVPAGRVRQLAPRPRPLQDEEKHRRQQRDDRWQRQAHAVQSPDCIGIGRTEPPDGSRPNRSAMIRQNNERGHQPMHVVRTFVGVPDFVAAVLAAGRCRHPGPRPRHRHVQDRLPLRRQALFVPQRERPARRLYRRSLPRGRGRRPRQRRRQRQDGVRAGARRPALRVGARRQGRHSVRPQLGDDAAPRTGRLLAADLPRRRERALPDRQAGATVRGSRRQARRRARRHHHRTGVARNRWAS